jgi:hypothetical protein
MARSVLSYVLKLITIQHFFYQSFVDAFTPAFGLTHITDKKLFAVPTNDQLLSDPFMKQVVHASSIVEMLSDDNDCDKVYNLVCAQLSHSDGIRGFFAIYLTGEGITLADSSTIPLPLANALKSAPDHKTLISISCKNVIMPTAMSSMHSDDSLRNSSSITASRGKTVLSYLKELYPDDVTKVCEDILAAISTENINNDENLNYWRTFFKANGYQEKQLQDIATALQSLCGN